MEIEEILEENERRNAKAEGGFDPISGFGSVGERYETVSPVNARQKVWLPVEMKRMPLTEKNYEELRCRCDFPYWAARYCKIKRKGGGDDILFRLNRPQRKFVDAMERDRTAGRPIRLILLKARQWGGSTHCHLLIYLEYIEPQPITANVKNFKQKEPMDCPISSFSIS